MADSENLDVKIETTKAVIQTLVAKAIQLFAKYVKKESTSANHSIPAGTEFGDKIANHFSEVYNWSKAIEFIGLGRPLETMDKTVNLTLTYKIRIQSDPAMKSELVGEEDLIADRNNYIVFGDPGSGKSTTLKRLLSFYFFSANAKKSKYNYPLLVKFRDINEHQTLLTYICDLLGIQYEGREVSYIVKVAKRQPVLDKNGKRIVLSTGLEQYEEIIVEEERKRTEYFSNGEKIEIVVARLLDDNKVLLIMDGLDEVNQLIAGDVQKQIIQLSSKTLHAKILVTCRPDYLEEEFSNFARCQICDLTDSQLVNIARLWFEDTSGVVESLMGKSYADLARRPLFLCFLLLLYKENQKLPFTSKEVYRQIIDLLVLRWDKSRGIKRESGYTKFDSSKKLEFLSHLSFTLTYILKTKSFDESGLAAVYKKIYERFELPPEDEYAVCRELENHTGIIVKAYFKKYEFSHLSIQEYLSAHYIVSTPYSKKIYEYIKESPAPVAMAMAMSPQTSLWFSKVILELFAEEYIRDTNSSSANRLIKIILRKLLLEAPYFDIYLPLGLSVMGICRICDCNDSELISLLERFINFHRNILDSLNLALENYQVLIPHDQGNRIILTRRNYFTVDGFENNEFLTRLVLPASLKVNGLKFYNPERR